MTKWFHLNYIIAGVCIEYLVHVLATLSAIPKHIVVEKTKEVYLG